MEHEDEDDEDGDEMADGDAEAQTDENVDVRVSLPASPVTSGSVSGSDRRSSSSGQSETSSAPTVPTILSPERESRDGPCDEAAMDIDDDMDIPSNADILSNKRAHPTFNRLFRSKGEFFLATRPHRAGDWSQAGAMLTLTGGRPWFCTLPPEEYTTGDAEVDSLVQHDIKKGGEWGDRRQELVFIGEKLDHDCLKKLLDGCLLTNSEMAAWEGIMRDNQLDDSSRVEALQDAFDDGFPDWIEDEEEEEEDEEVDKHTHTGHLVSHSLKQNVLTRSLKASS